MCHCDQTHKSIDGGQFQECIKVASNSTSLQMVIIHPFTVIVILTDFVGFGSYTEVLAISKFSPAIQFIPATDTSTRFKLCLWHLLTTEQLSKHPGQSEHELTIMYTNSDLGDALSIMDRKKKCVHKAEQVEQHTKVKISSCGDQDSHTHWKCNPHQQGSSGRVWLFVQNGLFSIFNSTYLTDALDFYIRCFHRLFYALPITFTLLPCIYLVW